MQDVMARCPRGVALVVSPGLEALRRTWCLCEAWSTMTDGGVLMMALPGKSAALRVAPPHAMWSL
jgi:hypothetical protein